MSTQTHDQTTVHTPALTTQLFSDILNSTLSTFEICRRNDINIDQLRAVAESEHFRYSVECMRAIHAARTDAMLPAMQARALGALDAIASQDPTTPTHTETVRRAAAAVLRLKPTDPPEPDTQHNENDDNHPDNHPGPQPDAHAENQADPQPQTQALPQPQTRSQHTHHHEPDPHTKPRENAPPPPDD